MFVRWRALRCRVKFCSLVEIFMSLCCVDSTVYARIVSSPVWYWPRERRNNFKNLSLINVLSTGFIERKLLLLLFWSVSSCGGETRHTLTGEQTFTRHRSVLHQVNVRRFSLVSPRFLSLFSSSVSHPASIVSFKVIPVVPPLLGDCDRVNQCLFLARSHSLCALVFAGKIQTGRLISDVQLLQFNSDFFSFTRSVPFFWFWPQRLNSPSETWTQSPVDYGILRG